MYTGKSESDVTDCTIAVSCKANFWTETTDFLYNKFLGRNVKDSLRRHFVTVFRVDNVRSSRWLVTLVTLVTQLAVSTGDSKLHGSAGITVLLSVVPNCNLSKIRTSEVLSMALLNIHVLWAVTPCRWVSSSARSEVPLSTSRGIWPRRWWHYDTKTHCDHITRTIC